MAMNSNDSNKLKGVGRIRRNRKKTLPKSRSALSKYMTYVIVAFSFAVSVLYAEKDSYRNTIVIIVSVLIPLLFILEVMSRVLHMIEELSHIANRYDNQYSRLVKDVFYFPFSLIIIMIPLFCTHFYLYMGSEKNLFLKWYEMGATSVVFSLISSFFLQRNLGLKCGPLYDSIWIENSNGLDYGSGMANSFFHGYLKLIIPKTGTSETHLEEQMKDYEDTHRVKFEFYKLFILIPKSFYCPTSLKNDEISPSIEESSSLAPKMRTIAGVQNRVYKNSVYKIKSDGGKRVYVCAEYATPLKTFKDVASYNGEHSNYYKKHENDIVLQFYLTLQKTLKEHEDCTNFCELIFYDDKEENGSYKDVGQILLQRIRKLQKSSRGHAQSRAST